MDAPAPLPTPSAPPQRAARYVALAVLACVAALLVVRFVGQVAPSARVRQLLADAGAELYDRPLSARELATPLQAQNGQTQTLRQLGQHHPVLLVHLWASWCPPCVEELPEVMAVSSALAGSDCAMVGVSYDDDWAAASALMARARPAVEPGAVARDPLQGGVWLRDPQGQAGDPTQMLRTALGTDKLPETWVVQQGQVVARLVAGQNWTQPRLQRVLSVLCPRTRAARGAP